MNFFLCQDAVTDSPLFHDVIYFGNSYNESPLLYLCGIFARKKYTTYAFSMPGNFKRTFGCVTIIDCFWFSIPSRLGSLHYLCLSRDGMDGRLNLVLIWISLAVCRFSSLFTSLWNFLAFSPLVTLSIRWVSEEWE